MGRSRQARPEPMLLSVHRSDDTQPDAREPGAVPVGASNLGSRTPWSPVIHVPTSHLVPSVPQSSAAVGGRAGRTRASRCHHAEASRGERRSRANRSFRCEALAVSRCHRADLGVAWGTSRCRLFRVVYMTEAAAVAPGRLHQVQILRPEHESSRVPGTWSARQIDTEQPKAVRQYDELSRETATTTRHPRSGGDRCLGRVPRHPPGVGGTTEVRIRDSRPMGSPIPGVQAVRGSAAIPPASARRWWPVSRS
jgi:hypothetical protein